MMRAAESVALYRTLDNERAIAESLDVYGSIMLSQESSTRRNCFAKRHWIEAKA